MCMSSMSMLMRWQTPSHPSWWAVVPGNQSQVGWYPGCRCLSNLRLAGTLDVDAGTLDVDVYPSTNSALPSLVSSCTREPFSGRLVPWMSMFIQSQVGWYPGCRCLSVDKLRLALLGEQLYQGTILRSADALAPVEELPENRNHDWY